MLKEAIHSTDFYFRIFKHLMKDLSQRVLLGKWSMYLMHLLSDDQYGLMNENVECQRI